MSHEKVVVNSDNHFKKEQKNMLGGLIIGIIFVAVHILNTLKIMDLEMDTSGILYLGLFFLALGIFIPILTKGRADKQRITYTVENNVLTISGAQNKTFDLNEYVVTGKIFRMNLGKTITCELRLQPREGKRIKLVCLLDEESFQKLVNAVA